jgi:hypothetical protein
MLSLASFPSSLLTPPLLAHCVLLPKHLSILSQVGLGVQHDDLTAQQRGSLVILADLVLGAPWTSKGLFRLWVSSQAANAANTTVPATGPGGEGALVLDGQAALRAKSQETADFFFAKTDRLLLRDNNVKARLELTYGKDVRDGPADPVQQV